MIERAWILACLLGVFAAAGSGCAKGYIVKNCGTCHGTGKAKCTKCMSAGLTACDLCRGWGVQCCAACVERPQRKVCGRCKDRLPKCAKCAGTGGTQDCPFCEKGVSPRDGKACIHCDGKGTKRCRDCTEGRTGTCVCCGTPVTAEIKATLVVCVPCAGKGEMKCAVCLGTLEATCARCSGSGKVKSETKSGLFKGKDWD